MIWRTICSVMALLGIVVDAVAGGVLGYFFLRAEIGIMGPIFGVIAGFAIGMLSAAFFMMIVNLCEDVSVIKDHLERRK